MEKQKRKEKKRKEPQKQQRNKNVKFSMLIKLVMLAIIPAVVMAVFMAVYSTISLRNGMSEKELEGLRAVSESISASYKAIDSGAYTVSGDSLYKGSYNITGHTEVIDSFTATSNTDVTLFYGDTRMATSLVSDSTHLRIVGTKAADEVVNAVVHNGQEYASSDIIINDKHYFAYYLPLKNIDGKVIGMVFAGTPCESVNEYIASRVSSISIMAFFITMITIVIGVMIASKLAGSIKKIEKVIVHMASGDMTMKVDAKVMKRNDEIGSMARELHIFENKLSGIIMNIKESTQLLLNSGESLNTVAMTTSTSADEINSAIEEISNGALSQSEEVESAANEINEMGKVIQAIVEGVGNLSNKTGQMRQSGEESIDIIQQLSVSNDKSTEAIARIAKQVHSTNQSVGQIRTAVELITSIASETSLLSLNASIEAARAGEQGRGFAVVASEIQKLAEQSNGSAQKIENVINELLKESEMTVTIMDEVESIVAEQQAKLDETKRKVADVREGINSSRQETELISNNTVQCDNSRSAVIDLIQNLSAISEENAASTQETTASMQELNSTITKLSEHANALKQLAESLENDMQFFKL